MPISLAHDLLPGFVNLADFATTLEVFKGNVSANPVFERALPYARGGVLYIPAGKYVLASPVNFPANVAVLSAPDAVLPSNWTTSPMRVPFFSPIFCTPSGGLIIGSSNLGDPGPGGVRINGTLLVQNLSFFSAPTATSATSGGATALPTAPAGYLVVNINGANVKIPYYNV